MNEQIGKVNSIAAALEAFITAHPISLAFIVATICSWTLTAALKPWVVNDSYRGRTLRTVDCILAGVIAALMLHGFFEWRIRLGLCLLVGSFSPFAYFIVSEALCWKWPALRKYLSLRELAPEAIETGTESQVPPPGQQ